MPPSLMPKSSVRVQAEAFSVEAEIAALTEGRTDIGAVVTFSGLCRDEAGTLAALEIEHYPGMAEAEIARVVAEAEARWPLAGVRVIHRHGRMAPSAQIVLVVTASRHRAAAFEAASFLMDYLKASAPFWKKEHRVDGNAGDWVAAKASDDEAAARWD
ncbi:molybdopterin synthase, large subunit [Beijerinckiaceae bacterium RH AL1]|nr:molybdenum cofactor biosynthesis protein MoaE [Beijerinckiaceae bacterium]VVB49829.1 molybdopterin synthase, large subunit [Beijerinckiaceae bacterium RH CH11]VVB49906.1 molybdopterin synthase, large subunit [Beijerinckiaceae bacterium RH AL8]VVC57097.1 molybdopterin synthase, large subunit [Beijerinckiaceae bacterium RH AL1]